MNKFTTFASGFGLGVAFNYLFDKDRGARHRALARDRAAHYYRSTPEFASRAARDLGNRARGLVAAARTAVTDGTAPDHIIVERVRAKLGRFVSHPGSIEVTATDGTVTLRGPVLRHEVDTLLKVVRAVPGVKGIDNRLQVYADGINVPGLQGGVPRPGERMEWRQEHWSPGARMAAILGGGALGYSALRMRGISALLAGLAGTGLALRGLTNLPLNRVFGLDSTPRVIEIQKSINIDAPVEEVFRLWTDFENFPRFMEHVQEVRRLGDGRLHWRVTGPAGSSVGWDAEIVEMIPNELIVWRTTDSDTIRQSGRTRFVKNPDGTTRLDVHLSYSPPAGAVGHIVATMAGVDPKRSMEQDLVRFQSLFKHGKTTAHGKTVTLEELAHPNGQTGDGQLPGEREQAFVLHQEESSTLRE